MSVFYGSVQLFSYLFDFRRHMTVPATAAPAAKALPVKAATHAGWKEMLPNDKPPA